jgi:ubiquinone/menaquinone biosynthesis C-methylase UbiE
LALIDKGKILEVGTGKGFMALELASRGHRLVSIDIDPGAKTFARSIARAKRLEKRVSFKIMDCACLKFQDRAFDYVVSVDFFHHLTAPVRGLKEMARVAKDTLVIADLNKSGTKLFSRIHAKEGRVHEESRIAFQQIRGHLTKEQFLVKTYRRKFHTVLVARRKEF